MNSKCEERNKWLDFFNFNLFIFKMSILFTILPLSMGSLFHNNNDSIYDTVSVRIYVYHHSENIQMLNILILFIFHLIKSKTCQPC